MIHLQPGDQNSAAAPQREIAEGHDESARSGVTSLLAAILVIVVCWGVVLPALGRWRPIRLHLDAMERRQINTGAMFYTELNESERHRRWLFDPAP